MTSTRSRGLAIALSALVGLGVVAATPSATTATPAAADALTGQRGADPAPRLTVRVRFTERGVGLDTAEVTPGPTVFRVGPNGSGGEVVLVDLADGVTPAELSRLDRRVTAGRVHAVRRLNRAAVFFGGVYPNIVGPTRFALDLPAGRFHVVHLGSGKAAALQVTGESQERTLPSADAVADFVPPTDEQPRGIAVADTIATSGWIQHTNHADQALALLIDPMTGSTTEESVAEFFDSHGEQGDLQGYQGYTPSVLLSPGQTYSWQYEVRAGKVLLWSFVPRLADGEIHAWHGTWALTRAEEPTGP